MLLEMGVSERALDYWHSMAELGLSPQVHSTDRLSLLCRVSMHIKLTTSLFVQSYKTAVFPVSGFVSDMPGVINCRETEQLFHPFQSRDSLISLFPRI